MNAVTEDKPSWLPEHAGDCTGFWLRRRHGGYHVEWRDPVTRRIRSKKVGTTYTEAYEATRYLARKVRLGKPVTPTSARVPSRSIRPTTLPTGQGRRSILSTRRCQP